MHLELERGGERQRPHPLGFEELRSRGRLHFERYLTVIDEDDFLHRLGPAEYGEGGSADQPRQNEENPVVTKDSGAGQRLQREGKKVEV